MPDRHFELTIGPADAGLRLDVILAKLLPELSRSQAKRLLDAGQVTLDGQRAKARLTPREGQIVALTIPAPQPTDLAPEALPLDVVYEDADLLVINKAASMLTHPGGGEYRGTLVNALLAYCDDLSGIGGEERPGIVHRLDRETSGLLMVAKHDVAHRALSEQLRDRTAGRRYLALAYGDPAWSERTVDAPLGRHHNLRIAMAVREDGRPAVTHLTCLERFGPACLLSAKLESGRTHQVRVHCTHVGHPLLGDPLYGKRRAREAGPLPPAVQAALEQLPGQALHAAELTFVHPTTHETLTFHAAPPPAFSQLRAALGDLAGAT